jgi:hypothetical protein
MMKSRSSLMAPIAAAGAASVFDGEGQHKRPTPYQSMSTRGTAEQRAWNAEVERKKQ